MVTNRLPVSRRVTVSATASPDHCIEIVRAIWHDEEDNQIELLDGAFLLAAGNEARAVRFAHNIIEAARRLPDCDKMLAVLRGRAGALATRLEDEISEIDRIIKYRIGPAKRSFAALSGLGFAMGLAAAAVAWVGSWGGASATGEHAPEMISGFLLLAIGSAGWILFNDKEEGWARLKPMIRQEQGQLQFLMEMMNLEVGTGDNGA